MTNPSLMRELDFSAADLAANRDGQLSETQVNRLRLQRNRAAAAGLGILFVLALVASICIFAGTRGSGILLVIGLGLTIVSAVVMSMFARYLLRLSADIRESKTSAFSGTLERIIKPVNRRVATYLLRVGGAEFSVTKDVFKVFEHETAYTLYRAKFTGMLLSAEESAD
ncbi:MAG: hypothetical protein KA401_00750 [Anaerolineae bacterium]|nr:hypothetical protein [Chloroflexota bacterium]MBP6297845.1 hypothetical protein [Anaerolineae bacterium]